MMEWQDYESWKEMPHSTRAETNKHPCSLQSQIRGLAPNEQKSFVSVVPDFWMYVVFLFKAGKERRETGNFLLFPG